MGIKSKPLGVESVGPREHECLEEPRLLCSAGEEETFLYFCKGGREKKSKREKKERDRNHTVSVR